MSIKEFPRFAFFILFSLHVLNTPALAQKDVYEVQVNAIGNAIKDSNKTYFLVLGDSVNTGIDDLENSRYIQLLTGALDAKGYKRVIDSSKAAFKYLLVFNYNISGPKEIELTQYKPVYNQSNNSTTNVNVNVNTQNKTTSSSNSNITPYGAVFKSDNNQAPTVSGYAPVKNTQIFYLRNMSLICFEKSEAKFIKRWFVDAESIGYSDDLRLILPILLFASKDYFEKDSKNRKTLSIKAKDRDLKKFLESTEE